MTNEIKCGHIYVFGKFNFTFNCDFCTNVYRASEENSSDIDVNNSHIPQSPVKSKRENSICIEDGSDNGEFVSRSSETEAASLDQDNGVYSAASDLQGVASSQSAAENLSPVEPGM